MPDFKGRSEIRSTPNAATDRCVRGCSPSFSASESAIYRGSRR